MKRYCHNSRTGDKDVYLDYEEEHSWFIRMFVNINRSKDTAAMEGGAGQTGTFL